MPATLVVALAAVTASVLAPGQALAGSDCRDKKGPRFDVKMSGSEESHKFLESGNYSQTTKWSAKWKKVRLHITRCDGELHRITMDSRQGKIRTSVEYHEPDRFIPPDDCAPGAFCPRRARAAGEGTTIEGCNFSHSGRYHAGLGVNAYFRGRHSNVVVQGGPRDERLARDERAAQEAACGEAGKVGFLPVRPYQSDGFEWHVSGYFATAVADQRVPQLMRDLARGRGGTASAPSRTRMVEREDSQESTTVAASVTFGQGSRIRNRFPDGF